ncbi:hypothetical protein KGF54_000187 [Candida jiufengensis]|uniref:uncharacterized protein n=1 Tax=Candida jiufengensis TaxID=497108 RepID=UPI002224B0BB|nr:uncharacterized protein KGF54_000187 [Candida jiufengensis]KAI5957259.1 hypothetical protein KGF54_000187 [Candida jiufengensis]
MSHQNFDVVHRAIKYNFEEMPEIFIIQHLNYHEYKSSVTNFAGNFWINLYINDDKIIEEDHNCIINDFYDLIKTSFINLKYFVTKEKSTDYTLKIQLKDLINTKNYFNYESTIDVIKINLFIYTPRLNIEFSAFVLPLDTLLKFLVIDLDFFIPIAMSRYSRIQLNQMISVFDSLSLVKDLRTEKNLCGRHDFNNVSTFEDSRIFMEVVDDQGNIGQLPIPRSNNELFEPQEDEDSSEISFDPNTDLSCYPVYLPEELPYVNTGFFETKDYVEEEDQEDERDESMEFFGLPVPNSNLTSNFNTDYNTNTFKQIDSRQIIKDLNKEDNEDDDINLNQDLNQKVIKEIRETVKNFRCYFSFGQVNHETEYMISKSGRVHVSHLLESYYKYVGLGEKLKNMVNEQLKNDQYLDGVKMLMKKRYEFSLHSIIRYKNDKINYKKKDVYISILGDKFDKSIHGKKKSKGKKQGFVI